MNSQDYITIFALIVLVLAPLLPREFSKFQYFLRNKFIQLILNLTLILVLIGKFIHFQDNNSGYIQIAALLVALFFSIPNLIKKFA